MSESMGATQRVPQKLTRVLSKDVDEWPAIIILKFVFFYV